MGYKIYLSPSNQDANIYATRNTNEYVQCNKIAEALSEQLKRYGFDVKIADFKLNLAERCAESKEWCADLHIPIHTNAGGGKGIEVYVYNSISKKRDEAIELGKLIINNVKAVSYTGVSRGVKTRALYELVHTPFSVYPEIEFHDNKTYANWIINNTDKIATAIREAICEYYGVKEEIKPVKTNEEIAKETILGLWGNGSARKKNLTAAGYDYNTIQRLVNDILAAKDAETKKKQELEKRAKECILGLWGNGTARRKNLTAAGYDYYAIQRLVNEMYRG